jgi:hypothetical protein
MNVELIPTDELKGLNDRKDMKVKIITRTIK